MVELTALSSGSNRTMQHLNFYVSHGSVAKCLRNGECIKLSRLQLDINLWHILKSYFWNIINEMASITQIRSLNARTFVNILTHVQNTKYHIL